MIHSNYQIKTISQTMPSNAVGCGKIRGLKSFIMKSQPHVFILQASGKFYTIEYTGVSATADEIPAEYDELNQFVDVIKPYLIWDLIQ